MPRYYDVILENGSSAVMNEEQAAKYAKSLAEQQKKSESQTEQPKETSES